jgi:hypothetical protein
VIGNGGVNRNFGYGGKKEEMMTVVTEEINGKVGRIGGVI